MCVNFAYEFQLFALTQHLNTGLKTLAVVVVYRRVPKASFQSPFLMGPAQWVSQYYLQPMTELQPAADSRAYQLLGGSNMTGTVFLNHNYQTLTCTCQSSMYSPPETT